MRAVVFHKPKDVRVERIADPRIEAPRDAIVRVTATAICGSDLHIYNGAIPQLRPMVLGHELVGVVEEVGADVHNLRRGDRVVVPFPIACGHCWFCERGWSTQCERSNPDRYGPESALSSQKGGGLLGYTDLYGGYDGGQAELVRVPFADYGPRKVAPGLTDEQVLFLSGAFPAGWCSIEWAQLRPGETVAVFGCGPVGLMAQKAAWLQGADRVFGVDPLPERLEMARRTAHSETIDIGSEDAVDRIRELTNGRGADVCVDAVGMQSNRGLLSKLTSVIHMQRDVTALELCARAVRRGGRISVMGIYPAEHTSFPLAQLMDKAIALRTGQAIVHDKIDRLMELVRGGRVVLDDIITHRLPLQEAPHAYDMFNRREDRCVKVVMRP